MTSRRPRIEGFAIISREGMIAASDGSFPETLKIPADQKFYQDSVDRAAAVANGRHSSEGGPKEAARRRIVLTRRVERVVSDPDNANAALVLLEISENTHNHDCARLNLHAWAVQAALDRRRRKLPAKDLSLVKSHTLNPELVRWPDGRDE